MTEPGAISRVRKLAQTIWRCQYNIIWVLKYRFWALDDKVAEGVEHCIRAFFEKQGLEAIKLNV
ncbi:MAG: transposase [Pirellulales bacterium]|nr:transposase [Pirellulales bacterium]